MKRQWEKIAELSEFWAFNGLWLFVRDEHKSFSEARKVFLGVVEELLAHGRIKLSRSAWYSEAPRLSRFHFSSKLCLSTAAKWCLERLPLVHPRRGRSKTSIRWQRMRKFPKKAYGSFAKSALLELCG